MSDIRLEICCADIESVLAAKEGGADRVELCAALESGGLTPSRGLTEEAIAEMGAERVNVLIRPRPGDFVYSPAEKRVMEKDIREAVACGAGGIVIGALLPDGAIDSDFCRGVRGDYPDVTLTFHRAFDLTGNPLATLDELMDMGFDRVLTSGCARDAYEGRDIIRQLVTKGEGRIDVMAGCGVTASNILSIIRETGVRDIHASAKVTVANICMPGRSDVQMGVADRQDGGRLATGADEVRELKRLINSRF